MIEKPGIDEGRDCDRARPAPGCGSEVIFEASERGIKSVGDGGFERAAEAFDRVELRAVRRQRQEP